MAVSKRKPAKPNPNNDGSKGGAVLKPRPCVMCGEKGEYYLSKNPIYAKTGHYPWCKSCMIEIFGEAYRRFQDYEKSVIELCKKINVPFYTDCFSEAKLLLENRGVEI